MSKKNLSLWMDGFMGEANPTDQAKELPQEQQVVLKTVDIRSPKTGISVHYSYSLLMAMQIY